MGKHFHYRIRSDGFTYSRKQANIESEESLDGIYVIRTKVPAESVSGEQAVRHCQELAGVERAFRSLKTLDLSPPHPPSPRGSRPARTCSSACWRTTWSGTCAKHWPRFCSTTTNRSPPKRCAPPLSRLRSAPPQRKTKHSLNTTDDDLPVHSFQTLLQDLRTVTLNTVQMARKPAIWSRPLPLVQQRAFDLLKLSCRA